MVTKTNNILKALKPMLKSQQTPENIQNITNILYSQIMYSFSKNRLLFVRIPRTGSTTIVETFNLRGRNKVSHYAKVRHYAAEYLRNEIYGPEEWDNKISFTLVRNPWARALSWYNHCTKRREIKEAKFYLMYRKYRNFESWVKDGMPIHWTPRNRPNQPIDFFWQQHRWITDENGKQLVSFVHQTENMHTLIKKIYKEIQLVPDDIFEQLPEIPLEQINRTNKTNDYYYYRDHYSEETKNIVAEICQLDIKTYNYTF